MFEVYDTNYPFVIASFLYKSDAEMFIRATRAKLPELADRYTIRTAWDNGSWWKKIWKKIKIFH